MVNLLMWIAFGALAGWIASLLARTDAEQGAVGNVVVGLIGALVGGLVMKLIGNTEVTGFSLPNFLVAVVGSVILLFVFNGVHRNS